MNETTNTHAEDALLRLEDRFDAKVRDALAAAEKLRLAQLAAIEERIRGVELVAKMSQESASLAVKKAEAATERRFEAVNEFRGQLADQTRTFLPRETFDTTLSQWQEWRTDVDADRATLRGRTSGINASIGALVLAAGFVATFLGIVVILANVLTK